MPLERLQKIIAKAGISSRREAEDYIREGRVTVNGKVVTELGTRADPLRDHVKVDGKLVQAAEEHRYILMNKPREVMTTTVDPEGRTTVLDLMRGVRERLFPVGRLDYHSEGLLLLTNDGDLAYRVSHPSNGSIKTYHVKVRGVPPMAVIDKLSRGVVLDGKRTLPCEIHPLRTTGRADDEGNSWWEVRLREGRTNQIRRMFQYQGFPVSKLRRVGIGGLTDPKLGPGDWRELTDREIQRMLEEPAAPRAPRTRRAPAARKKPSPTSRTGSRGGARGASTTSRSRGSSRGSGASDSPRTGGRTRTPAAGSSSRSGRAATSRTSAGSSRTSAGGTSASPNRGKAKAPARGTSKAKRPSGGGSKGGRPTGRGSRR